MMSFIFNAETFRDLFHHAVEKHLQDEAPEKNQAELNSPYQLLAAMDQAIDVMARVDADSTVKKQMSAENIGMLEEKEISKAGRDTLEILEAMVTFVQNKTGERNRDLLRLSLPVSLWVVRHGGKLTQIDMLVNSLAEYANELTETHLIADLTTVIKEVIEACDSEIRRDVEQTTMMRPWRVLNLNYGIVATRSHNPALIEQAYDSLVKNLPQDARQFFKDGMQQMNAIAYPDEVREVVERYYKRWGAESSLH